MLLRPCCAARRRPAELVSSTALCLQYATLGEAQALAAFRAEERGSSAALVAALQAGASELFEKASKALRDHAGE